ncbi:MULTISPECIES: helix-turn-helix domain-containing protein [Myroides]|jgi:DNA invertase Pin-like site-specific DNA recombinase|uniref:helix-turn-helix domain-containing protein n=1 Tax=Myroides TaxID=76831 RepID=UPI0015F9491E|nr:MULTISPECIES: helix-turn-helix domain-containing protein [Myroides]MDR2222071.1 helix-turn-helix domain-containing protein [Flavobacteriaceae bacterium]MBB1138242.1 helix-turn-helix domain-containing protein [Myroides sp. WP-1]MDM1037221.1 helix-turn-helix domain-containing protein [Myroides odoratimimus]MDM1051298.1 helix-turn-helix domain-containing protein [Myroides odoratimimus]MDM1083944.1 helix-turn-helix domain-containing protein [Myroides odoratimimus]
METNFETKKEGRFIDESQEVLVNTFFPTGDDRMSQQEVASMFDRTVQTIINWKNKGKIPYYEIDGRPIFSRKQLIQVASKNQHLLNP